MYTSFESIFHKYMDWLINNEDTRPMVYFRGILSFIIIFAMIVFTLYAGIFVAQHTNTIDSVLWPPFSTLISLAGGVIICSLLFVAIFLLLIVKTVFTSIMDFHRELFTRERYFCWRSYLKLYKKIKYAVVLDTDSRTPEDLKIIEEWCFENLTNIFVFEPVTIIDNKILFSTFNEEDALMFKLRWS